MINKKLIYAISTSILISIVYLVLDYCDVFSFITIKLNTDILGIVINALIVIVIFIVTYSLVDKKTIERDEKIRNNKIGTLKVMLEDVYMECNSTLNMLDNEEILVKYIVPKIDFNSIHNEIMDNIKNNPFKNEQYIIQLFSDGIVEEKDIKKYFELKNLYQKYVWLKVTLFDLGEGKDTKQRELAGLLRKDRDILRKLLNNNKT